MDSKLKELLSRYREVRDSDNNTDSAEYGEELNSLIDQIGTEAIKEIETIKVKRILVDTVKIDTFDLEWLAEALAEDEEQTPQQAFIDDVLFNPEYYLETDISKADIIVEDTKGNILYHDAY
jgi:hypothetical protein